MKTKQLIIAPKGAITPKDKEKMSKAGYLVIEAEDPSKVIMPVPSSSLASADDLLLSAMKAITASFPRQAFAEELARRIIENEGKEAFHG